MKLIVSVDRHWGIGSGSELLYHIPEDMKFFKSMTLGNTVVMGEKTFFSLPRQQPLADRENIVLSDTPGLEIDGVHICRSLEELDEYLAGLESDSVFIIGGAAVYSLMLGRCDTAYVTKIDSERDDADKFFPNLDKKPEWVLDESSERHEHNGIGFVFTKYTKKAGSLLQ